MIDLTGQQIGEWKVLKEAPRRGYHRYWLCECECGTQSEVNQGALRNGRSTRCKPCAGYKHPYGTDHTFYAAARGIINRCTNPNHLQYADWGGRGISVKPKWIKDIKKLVHYLEGCWISQFGSFDDVAKLYGNGKDQYSIDRIDNDGDYTTNNIRFATRVEQANNKREI